MLTLPETIAEAVAPLFAALPLEQAMGKLTGSDPKHTELVQGILKSAALADHPELAAGLWLYVDDLDRSHTVSQSLDDATGAYWHGIMHRREGDFSNSHYWMRRAAGHPLLHSNPDLAPDALIDQVASSQNKEDPALVQKQREEWATLFTWCATNR